MLLEQIGKKGLEYLPAVVVESTIFLFVNGFELGMEDTQHGVAETLCLHGNIFIQSIGRHVVGIDGLLERGESVCTLCTHRGHHFVVLVGDGVLAGNTRYGVYFFIDSLTLVGIFGFVVLLVKVVDFIEFFTLFFPVERTVFVGTFKQKMLEVMSQTCIGGRVGLATCLHSHIALYTWLFVGRTEDNGKTVTKGIKPCIRGVVGYIFVGVTATSGFFPLISLPVNTKR